MTAPGSAAELHAMLTDRNGNTVQLDGPTSWTPLALESILTGEHIEPEPLILRRTDGRCLLYPGRIHGLHAEPEGLKTWLALKATAEQLTIGETVLYIDFEDSAAAIIQRLLDLHVPEQAIIANLQYISPEEPLAERTIRDLDAALEAKPALAVIDGVTEAFARQGLSPMDNSDVAAWLELLPRRVAQTGAAVLALDHVVKDREARGRYAIGAQHKLAGVHVAYSLKVIEPFGRGRDGLVAMKVEKDRSGKVREFAKDGGQVATVRATSIDGRVRILLEPPDEERRPFRPTTIMERISRAVETDPGLSKRAIRETVGGRATTVDLALELLISEGHIRVESDGQARRHLPAKPYRVPRVPTVSPESRTRSDDNRVPVSPPLRGNTDTGHGNAKDTTNRDRVPDDLQTRAEDIINRWGEQ